MNKNETLKIIRKVISEAKQIPQLFNDKTKQRDFESYYLKYPKTTGELVKIKELLQKSNLFGQIQFMSSDTVQIEPKTPPSGKYDGMQIVFNLKTGNYEVSEYQAGENGDETYIYTNTKNYIEAVKSLLLGNVNRKPIKIVD